MLFCTVFALIFLTVGILFFTGGALRWVKGWQALDPKEKAAIRILPLCRNIGTVLALAGGILLAGGLVPTFREGALTWALMGWLVLGILDVLFIEKSGRYTNNKSCSRQE